MWPNGRIQKIDVEKIDEIVRYGYISERLKRIIFEKIDEALDALSLKEEKENRYINEAVKW